ncbi:hypothetical protein HYH03_018956 [Edaphochlamys debaryana]|uniref:ABC1 atypical kinase-like domain-containing protein n=1 Tax=Edaphochlamys debaryana TaxID=47281 RepID=A0A835XF08_9CHLO|nr:hypothetical protein HYH03_018956 [Edaphochlamys debaryana]|eukprot:KAG2482100.1 hypothetical protein HYH03_018956 [Edaphochlamys debaryana]
MRSLDGSSKSSGNGHSASSLSSVNSFSSLASVDLGAPAAAPTGNGTASGHSANGAHAANGTNGTNGNGTGFSNGAGGGGSGGSKGLVLARQPLGSYMPAVRSAAATIAEGIATETAWRSGGGSGAGVGVAERVVVVEAEAEMAERPSETDFKWAQDDYNATTRTIDTWTFFTIFRTRLWLLDQKWSYPGGFTDAKRSERARSLAKYLLTSILELGPTFIKIGQLSSTRSDLFPAEFVEELTTLQDRVPAFTAAKARAIIEKDLGPVEELFADFEDRPIAAASLGQVHRATLFTGEQVVVKVQRPGLKALFDIDLRNLQLLAEQLDKGDENRDFKGIYQECASVLYQEIDYLNEGRNADRFRRNFRTDAPWARVPRVYWQYCSPRVLVLEYLPGVKISDKAKLEAAGLDTDMVARRATESYLIQILKHGFFHADPHPGNVSVDPRTGDLLYYDFGMMGEIVPDVRTRLLDVFYGIYRKDTDQVLRALVALQVIKPTGDNLSIRRAIAYFIDNLSQQTERQATIQAIGEDLFAIAVDQPFRFPATFTFVLRAFSTLEGIGKTLNPEYRFSEVAQPYAAELLQLQDANGQRNGALLLEQVQQQATELGQAAAAMPLRIARMEATMAQLEAGDLKLRVRVLESERADRRQGILQLATLHTVAAVGLLNAGVTLALAGEGPAGAAAGVCLGGAGLFGVLVVLGMRRVQRLDKFEKDMRG